MKRYYVTGIRLVKSLGRGYDEAVVEAVLQYPFYEKEKYRAATEEKSMPIRVSFMKK